MTYTSVPDDANAEWSAATTYALNAIVKVTTATPHKLFKSLRSNNLNRAPASWLEPVTEFASSTTSTVVEIGSKTFTIETGKGFSVGMAVSITKTSTPMSVSLSGEVTSYNSSTGELVTSVYGVIGEGTHATWTIASVDEIGFWEDVGATNAWSMFDEYVNTKTVNQNSILFKLQTVGVNGIAFFGLNASKINLELWSFDETVKLWEESIDLVYAASTISQISDWYEYFFGEYSIKTDVSKEIGVRVQSGVLVVHIIGVGGTEVTCGQCVVGEMLDIGSTQYGSSAGMVDYSKRTEDSFGKVSIEQGYWAKRNSIQLIVENSKIDHVYKKMVAMRGTPTVWISNNESIEYEMLIVFGLFRDFDIVVQGPLHSYCSLNIEGLI